MSASEELIVAGVNAVMTKHYPMADGVTAALVHEDIAVALDAVEPIIRADERERIAQAIEAAMESHLNCPHPECAQSYRDAACIARGEEQP